MLKSRFADLQRIVEPQKTLEQFAGRLWQEGIINEAIAHNPAYHDIIGAFTAALPVLATIDDIETHCQKFIDALRELGGMGAMGCADELEGKWKAVVKEHDKKGMPY